MRWTSLAISIVLALSLCAPSFAQTASVPVQLAGTWAYDGTRERERYVAESAFASTVAALPELLQSYARGRIRSEMDPPRRVSVERTGARIRVSLAGDHTTVIEGALGAVATTTGVADGTRVGMRLQGGWLELAYEGEGSLLRQLLSTEPDGARMHLDYTVTGERLPQPVRYRLDFVRPTS